MKTPLLILALLLTSCTTFYERGQKIAVIGGDVDGLTIQTPAGTRITATQIRHSIIIQKVGAAVSQGIISAGGSVITGGIAP